jgi:FtsP/CotA-like multicopper oxidase with cupredoxin domain
VHAQHEDPIDGVGMWMYHCHILEQQAAGMMAHFEAKRS